ncbi:MAG: hypothetical protein JSS95_03360 [Acidobacteria bacterium]|nr:hypothetical protein [Acidobacteriota bacterium]
MHDRLKAMRRVQRVHELIEEMHKAELLRVVAEVQETKRAIGRQRAIAQSAAMEWRNALGGGDGLVASFSVVRRTAARGHELRLVPLLREKERRSEESRQRYFDSRQWTEKTKRLSEKVEDDLEALEEKRLQREADERFLARRRWIQLKSDADKR